MVTKGVGSIQDAKASKLLTKHQDFLWFSVGFLIQNRHLTCDVGTNQVPNSTGEELRKQLGAQLLAAADDGSLEAMLRDKARKGL